MIAKADRKGTKLTEILSEYFGKKKNLARIKLFGMFITALCKMQTVGFEKLAAAVKTSSW